MVELRVRRFGGALGVVLPDEVVARLNARAGAPLFLIEAPEGGYRLAPHDPSVDDKTAKAEDIMSRYGNALRALAQ